MLVEPRLTNIEGASSVSLFVCVCLSVPGLHVRNDVLTSAIGVDVVVLPLINV